MLKKHRYITSQITGMRITPRDLFLCRKRSVGFDVKSTENLTVYTECPYSPSLTSVIHNSTCRANNNSFLSLSECP